MEHEEMVDMTTINDTAEQLRELANLHRRRELIEETIEQRILTLWRAGGWSLQELGAAIGKRASQVSRIIARLEERSVSLADARRTITAMELVRRAQRGEIDHGEFVALLKNWRYDPKYTVHDESDDWEIADNSFDAVYHAYVGLDLLTAEEYEEIQKAGT
ncbi:hypothetical protein [Microbacterium aurantiacum]|uniref:Uncharacterized protein n=1 Tax=Microbacterium aurantiacum TaxID=162393 RepID=A0AAJ2HFI7_9MICO|nr:hypothetical protein [Microbacterium aurantiacum]MDS0244612.1 hypothetical protein [Microbacterium aurantiacum]